MTIGGRYLFLLAGALMAGALLAAQPGAAQGSGDDAFRLTYLGGALEDESSPRVDVAIDDAGCVFVVGQTRSDDISGGKDAEAATYDAFVAKFSNDLSELLTYRQFGGSFDEKATAVRIGADGRVYVSGDTQSPDFPWTSGAYDTVYNGTGSEPYGNGDLFVAVLSNDLQTVEAATFIGGGEAEHCHGLALARDGSVYITGSTNSSDFPHTAGAHDTTYNDVGTHKMDAYVCRLDADLTTLLAATFLGDWYDDFAEDVAVGPDGSVYVGGWTRSRYFPTTDSVAQPDYGGGKYDGFVTRYSADLTQMLGSTYLGGGLWNFVYCLTVDGNGKVFVSGHTASNTNFPTTASAYDETYNGTVGEGTTDDCFISRYSADLSELEASTLLGGTAWDMGWQLVVDDTGLVHVANSTTSADFAVGSVYLDTTHEGESDLCVSVLDNDLTHLLFTSLIGGNGDDNRSSLALDTTANVYTAGRTTSDDLPVTNDVYDTTYGGIVDVLVGRVDRGLFNDDDGDGDGVGDSCDVCIDECDPDQFDTDGDGVGDRCCCACPTLGNIDGSEDCLVTMGVLTVIIDHLFILLTPLDCPQEANLDMSTDHLVTMGDLTVILDHLFITLAELPVCA